MSHPVHRVTRHFFVWTILLVAIGLTGLRLFLAGIDHYKTDLTEQISALLGAPVSIGGIGAKMHHLSPRLIANEVVVHAQSGAQPALQIRELRLGLSLLGMVTQSRHWSSAWITISGARFTLLRKADGQLTIAGLPDSQSSPDWLLQGRRLAILDSEITWLDEKAGAKPVLLTGVDLVLKNTGSRHQVNILAQLPKAYGESLRLSLDLSGQPLAPSALQGHGYLEANKINLARWLPEKQANSVQFQSGLANAKLWLDWRQGQAQSATLLADLENAKLIHLDQPVYAIKHLQSRMNWQQSGSRWTLDIPDFQLTAQDKKWPNLPVNITGEFGQDPRLKNIGVYVTQADLRQVAGLIGNFPQFSQIRPALSGLQGRLQDMSVFADLEQNTGAVRGRFDHLELAANGANPGFSGLSGSIKGTDREGQIQLTGHNLQFSAPELFRQPLTIEKLSGGIDWQQTASKWILTSKQVAISLPGLNSNTRFQLDLPKQSTTPAINLECDFSSPDMTKASLYLPTPIMSSSLVNWLDHAFISGRIPKGKFLLRGALNKFPYTDNSGVFDVRYDVVQLELAYHPDWPHLTGLSGSVHFFKEAVQIRLDKGQSEQVNIKQTEIEIPNMNDARARLLVKGRAESDLAKGLAFLLHTPLKTKISPLLAAITPQGHSQLQINLGLPLVDNSAEKVDVTAALNQARLHVRALDLPVSQINGLIKVTETGVYSEGLKAVALAEPINITIHKDKQQTAINVAGTASVEQLQQQFKLPVWSIAKGKTDYRLSLGLPDKDNAPIQLTVQTGLTGIALDLPGDLAKSANQKRDLSLTFDINQKSKLPVGLNYDHKLKAALLFNIPKQTIESGHILIGEGNAKLSQTPGLSLEINRDHLALQDWLVLAGAQNTDNWANSPLKSLSVHSPHAFWKSTDLGRFDLDLKPDAKHWSGELHSQFADGKITIPLQQSGGEKIVLNMRQIDLSALTQLKSASAKQTGSITPEAMPLFSLSSAITLWHGHDLGMLDIESEYAQGGMIFKHIDLFGHDQKLTATGNWRRHGEGYQTQIQGRLEMPQAGNFFKHLGISKDISEASGTADFLFNWLAAPHQFSLDALRGQLTLDLKRGRILSIEPGFGRILGVIAVAQWINRLQLDFSDIYQEGLTFNSIKGRFDLVNGKAANNNLIVDAIPAKITLSGETDLVRKTVDQNVHVTPKSADAVPIAGTIMGKISTFIAKSLTGKEQEGFFFGSQYQLKGAWGNVQVIPLHENDGLLQKTWKSITNFPWQQPATQ